MVVTTASPRPIILEHTEKTCIVGSHVCAWEGAFRLLIGLLAFVSQDHNRGTPSSPT
ncbi:hypothetical protein BDN70DRAFT_884375 [Pholiota conissans]|uniref:Uncharacterized protein n=1 Tax=Pholiota conissans TaxID=109636 RepID=A0A9P5YTI0_9AGAR|nr:hypothetical protein BDN70DRAFT_884375 [Pholiota conissans]